jgi:glycine/D-amino acid oxidase-like deaminating enzyme
MDLAVQHLQTIGCRASGLISDEDLVKAVHSETRRHEYDKVILATGREGGRWLARALRLDPVHQLRRRMGQRLIIFPPGPGTSHSRS